MYHDKMLIDFFAELSEKLCLNRFITISLSKMQHGSRLTKHDVGPLKSLVSLYARKLSETKCGRSRLLNRNQDLWVPMIAIPEYRDKAGDPCHIHYHVLTQFDEKLDEQMRDITFKFWTQCCNRYFACIPDIDIRDLLQPQAVTRYALKNLEVDFTIENTIVVGSKK